MQIEAIWQYLLEGRQARAPRGLIREPIELVASDEAVMLRRKYPDVGKRGIGVGYPSQINLVYDAERMRLALLWEGKFADPGGVWYSQGHGVVRPLSRDVIRLSLGPDLDDAQSPWIVDEGRPPLHQFRGYTLDDQQRPTFRYTVGDVEVFDGFKDSKEPESGKAVLRRVIKLRSEGDDRELTLRLAPQNGAQVLDDGDLLINDAVRVQVEEDQVIKTFDIGGEKVFGLTLQVTKQPVQVELDYVWVK